MSRHPVCRLLVTPEAPGAMPGPSLATGSALHMPKGSISTSLLISGWVSRGAWCVSGALVGRGHPARFVRLAATSSSGTRTRSRRERSQRSLWCSRNLALDGRFIFVRTIRFAMTHFSTMVAAACHIQRAIRAIGFATYMAHLVTMETLGNSQWDPSHVWGMWRLERYR